MASATQKQTETSQIDQQNITQSTSQVYQSPAVQIPLGKVQSFQTDKLDRRILGIDQDRLASFLGFFSLGLGISQLIIPGQLNQLIGIKDDAENRLVMRLLGMRELTAGIGIFSGPKPIGWLWSRVIGDFMDLTLLARGFTAKRTRKDRLAIATTAVAGLTVLDLLCAMNQTRTAKVIDQFTRIKKAMTINRDPADLYQFWRNFENLPKIMSHLLSVEVSGNHSHWVAKAPAGLRVSWDAEIVEDRPNELIAWQSLPGSSIETTGFVKFRKAPGNRGTEMIVELIYNPPAGAVGEVIAKLFREEPSMQLKADLPRFKQLMETGEIVVSNGSLIGVGRPLTKDEFDQFTTVSNQR